MLSRSSSSPQSLYANIVGPTPQDAEPGNASTGGTPAQASTIVYAHSNKPVLRSPVESSGSRRRWRQRMGYAMSVGSRRWLSDQHQRTIPGLVPFLMGRSGGCPLGPVSRLTRAGKPEERPIPLWRSIWSLTRTVGRSRGSMATAALDTSRGFALSILLLRPAGRGSGAVLRPTTGDAVDCRRNDSSNESGPRFGRCLLLEHFVCHESPIRWPPPRWFLLR